MYNYTDTDLRIQLCDANMLPALHLLCMSQLGVLHLSALQG